jgi:hypothetical protein
MSYYTLPLRLQTDGADKQENRKRRRRKEQVSRQVSVRMI